MRFSFKKVTRKIPPFLPNAPGMLVIDYEQKGRTWGSLFKNETSTARPKGHHFAAELHIDMRVSLRVTIQNSLSAFSTPPIR